MHKNFVGGLDCLVCPSTCLRA